MGLFSGMDKFGLKEIKGDEVFGEQEKKKAINEAKDEIGGLAMDIAGKVVEKEINEADHRKLIEDFMLAANQTVAEHFFFMESPLQTATANASIARPIPIASSSTIPIVYNYIKT